MEIFSMTGSKAWVYKLSSQDQGQESLDDNILFTWHVYYKVFLAHRAILVIYDGLLEM